jgi:RNA polymerase sigma-70 factor (ECF subfamily)
MNQNSLTQHGLSPGALHAERRVADPTLEAQLPSLRTKLLRHARLVVRDQSLAEDLTQDTLISVLQFHTQRRGDATLSTWAISILKHKIADWYRSPAKTRMVLASDEDAKLGESVAAQFDTDGKYAERIPAWLQPESAEENRQMFTVLEDCVSCLPAQTARVFMMREWLGFETAEICERLHVTAENTRTMLHRARVALRECMQRKWLATKATA